MARYLVTGCAGFIGSNVAAQLLADGHTVVGVDNLNDAYDVQLKHWRLERLQKHEAFHFHRIDICDHPALRDLIYTVTSQKQNGAAPFAAILNLAARAGVRQSVEDPWCYFETNVTGTLNLLELCREFGIPKFVLASTSSLYGKSSQQPFQEDARTSKPLSPYAASKKAAEVLCYTYHSLYEIDVTIVRYFTVYGPAGRPDMSLFRFVQWISEGKTVTVYGDGRQSRDFTYVEDIARGTIAALKPIGYEIINLGSDHPVVLADTIHMIERLVGKPARLTHLERHPADVTATWADIRKAKELLGWQPQVPFEDGIEHLVDWYQENAQWARTVETG